MATDIWDFVLDRSAMVSDIKRLNDERKEDEKLTNNNIALLSQRLDRIDANQTLITKALMQLSSPQADQFALSSPPSSTQPQAVPQTKTHASFGRT
jgi:hypothetical protein